jgi:hypothetical protein
MNSGKELMKITHQIESSLSEIPWTRVAAAGSFALGALLLITGHRKAALVAAGAGAAAVLAEHPDMVRDAWNSMPRYVRAGQDFLVRVEDFAEELNKQGIRIRKVLVND